MKAYAKGFLTEEDIRRQDLHNDDIRPIHVYDNPDALEAQDHRVLLSRYQRKYREEQSIPDGDVIDEGLFKQYLLQKEIPLRKDI